MRFVMFYHSLISDWNHGNAHFLRGIVRELLERGHEVHVYEPADGWSLTHLRSEAGDQIFEEFTTAFPGLSSRLYDRMKLDLPRVLEGADVVIVHEWNDPELVGAIGRHRARHDGYRLLFHDTHHRSVTAAAEMRRYELDHYDGVLAFGDVIRQVYLDRGWTGNAWTWHEAADVKSFTPRNGDNQQPLGDVVWVGNWGDEERSQEIREFFILPVRWADLTARAYGVRYPADALRDLSGARIFYGGRIPNHQLPGLFSDFACTIHIPRRPYRYELPGIPTIRVFEALACEIPLVCLRWDDSEKLFSPGRDYLVVDTPNQMTEALYALTSDADLAGRIAAHGRKTILSRHTCSHRVDELFRILAEMEGGPPTEQFSRSINGVPT